MFKNKLNIAAVLILFIFASFRSPEKIISSEEIKKIEYERVVNAAELFMKDSPLTITNFVAVRSAGGKHDFYSEGDYWWPDPKNPDAPYIRKDGLTNPDNFTEHRKALINFSIKASTLTAAYKITGDKKYAYKAIEHLLAWFVNENTKMNSNLLYAQAVKGRFTGRGIGIIDTIHLVEVVQAIIVLEKGNILSGDNLAGIKKWFSEYLNWITTHQFGIDERDNGNNHSTCWAMQAAQYSKLVNDTSVFNFCKRMYTDILLPEQTGADGSFPRELARTKPFGYSLFNLDVMSTLCFIISDDVNNFFLYSTPDGRNLKKAIEFIQPYIKDKTKWPYQKDVMYFDNWPVRHPSLLFAGIKLNDVQLIDLWKKLDADPKVDEIIRNYPIRQPVLWI